jgi:hypothetical protein
MLKADTYLERAAESERWAELETQDEIQALYLKSAESWRALATVAQLAEGVFTTEYD